MNAQRQRAAAPAPDGSLGGAVARTWRAFSRDRIMATGAGATFYILLALFPAIGALVSIYGLFADPATIASNVSALSAVVPGGGMTVIHDELQRLAQAGGSKLSFAFVAGFAVSLWSANAGMKAIFDALNVAYEEEEKRSFLRLNAISLLFTVGAVVFVAATIGLLVVLPHALAGLPIDNSVIAGLRYPLLVLATLFALACLYRFGPDRAHPRWRWVSFGSAFATTFWIIASIGFTWYAAHFGSFNATYGSLGAIMGFMTWLWLSVTIVLIGATLDCEIEKRAGARSAHTADAPTPSSD